jgi:outer membrane protein assembly factor BamB
VRQALATFLRFVAILACLPGLAPPITAARGDAGTIAVYRGDAARTGQQPGPGPSGVPLPDEGILAATQGIQTFTPPVVADGRLFVGPWPDTLEALDATTGASLWKYRPSGAYYADDAVAVAAGTVYVPASHPRNGGTDGAVFAVDAATGREVWQFFPHPAEGPFTGPSSPVVAGGAVYFGTTDGALYSLDAASGAVRWRLWLGKAALTRVAVNDGTVSVGGADGALYAVDGATGTPRWRVETGGALRDEASVADGVVHVVSLDGTLHALDAGTGAERWKAAIPVIPGVEPTARPVTSQAVASGVVVVTGRGIVFAVDAQTGAERWRYATHETFAPELSAPSVAGGVVYAVSVGGMVYALDLATGKPRWRLSSGVTGNWEATPPPPGAPAVVGGVVYAVTADGVLYAVTDAAHLKSQAQHFAATPVAAETPGAAQASASPAPTHRLSTGVAMHRGDAARTGRQPGPGPRGIPVPDERFSGGTMPRHATSSPVGAAGIIYVGTASLDAAGQETDWSLDAVDTSTGLPVWQFRPGGGFGIAPAVAHGVVLAVGSDSGDAAGSGRTIFAVDAAAGTEIWHLTLSSPITYSPDVSHGVVFVGTAEGRLYALDAATGRKEWSKRLTQSSLVGWCIGDGTVFVADATGVVFAVDAAAGTLRWRTELGAATNAIPATANGLVYVSTGNGYVVALQGATGALAWSHSFAFGQSGTSAVASGLVVTSRDNGALNAYDALTGADDWTFQGDGSALFSPSVSGTTVYVASQSGLLYAVDLGTGTELWHFATPVTTTTNIVSTPVVMDGVVYFVNPGGVLSAVTGSDNP